MTEEQNNSDRQFYAKILLFGEHTLLFGQQALAVPGRSFSGQWVQNKPYHMETDLFSLADYLKEHQYDLHNQLDVDAFLQDLNAGWTFESSIPVGSGLGSSGAFTAGIYQRYGCITTCDLKLIREDLALIESFFHGKSSGIDPLVSYTDRPLALLGGVIAHVDIDAKLLSCFELVNTRMPRQGKYFIHLFHHKMQDEQFATKLNTLYIPALNQAIDALIAGDGIALEQAFFEISFFQLVWMSEFIPPGWIRQWEQRLIQRQKMYKLLGAGGGGYLLQFNAPSSKR